MKQLPLLGNNPLMVIITVCIFCGDLFTVGDTFENSTYNLRMIISYATTVIIENTTGYDATIKSNGIYTIYRNNIEIGTTSKSIVVAENNCVEINFKPTDDNDAQLGERQLVLENEIVGYCSTSGDTNYIDFCGNDNHISHCIGPDYCGRFDNVFITDYELDEITDEMI